MGVTVCPTATGVTGQVPAPLIEGLGVLVRGAVVIPVGILCLIGLRTDFTALYFGTAYLLMFLTARTTLCELGQSLSYGSLRRYVVDRTTGVLLAFAAIAVVGMLLSLQPTTLLRVPHVCLAAAIRWSVFWIPQRAN